MGKTWGDDKLRELNRTAEEHALAAHIDEAYETSVTEAKTPGEERAASVTELYDQDFEPIENAVTILPSRCGLCGTLFENPPWDPEQGSLCRVCGATTKVSR